MTVRDEKGRWQPGSSGNTAGRRPTAGVISELAESESENWIKLLIEIRDNKKAPLALRKASPLAAFFRGPAPSCFVKFGLMKQMEPSRHHFCIATAKS